MKGLCSICRIESCGSSYCIVSVVVVEIVDMPQEVTILVKPYPK